MILQSVSKSLCSSVVSIAGNSTHLIRGAGTVHQWLPQACKHRCMYQSCSACRGSGSLWAASLQQNVHLVQTNYSRNTLKYIHMHPACSLSWLAGVGLATILLPRAPLVQPGILSIGNLAKAKLLSRSGSFLTLWPNVVPCEWSNIISCP